MVTNVNVKKIIFNNMKILVKPRIKPMVKQLMLVNLNNLIFIFLRFKFEIY